jgi:hypothetical protein
LSYGSPNSPIQPPPNPGLPELITPRLGLAHSLIAVHTSSIWPLVPEDFCSVLHTTTRFSFTASSLFTFLCLFSFYTFVQPTYTMRSVAFLPFAAIAMAYEAPPPLKNQIAGPILGIYAMCGNDPIDCGQGWCCQKGQQCVVDSRNNIMCYDPELSEANKYVSGHFDALCLKLH